MNIIKDSLTEQRLISLPPSCKFILYLLKRNGPLTQENIMRRSLLPKRTVVYSLRKLYDLNFIRKYGDKRDKRIRFYEILI
ncbi:MAG: MarR family transcriptional regulator [Promethearchaeota archaeon]